MRKLFTILVFVLSTSIISAQTQTAWNFDSGTGSNAPSGVQTGMTAEDAIFTIGVPSYESGYVIGPAGPVELAYASNGWTTNTTTYNSGEYFQLEINATGDNLDLSQDALQLVIKRNTNGPQKIAVTTSIDGHTTVFHNINLNSEAFTGVNIQFDDDFDNLSNLEVRFHGYHATNASGLLIFDEIAFELLNVLPVELAYFDGQIENKSTVLNWATYSEEDNAYFEVMHSTDGVGFQTIDIIEGAGTSIDYNEYQYIHETPENGINYYRLRQVDFDGQSSYTDIITVEYKYITTADIKVFPNPTVDYVNIQLPQNDISTDIMIYNMNGQVMQTVNNIYDNHLELNVIDWLTGQYIVIIQQGNQRITTQFIKF